MISASDYMMLKIRGYEYDGDNDCIVEYKENGQFDRCRKGFIKKTGKALISFKTMCLICCDLQNLKQMFALS